MSHRFLYFLKRVLKYYNERRGSFFVEGISYTEKKMSVYNSFCSIFLKFRRESGINPILSGQHLKSDVFLVAHAAVACSGVQSVKQFDFIF